MGAHEEQHQRSLRGREATREVMDDQSNGELRMLMERGRGDRQQNYAETGRERRRRHQKGTFGFKN